MKKIRYEDLGVELEKSDNEILYALAKIYSDDYSEKVVEALKTLYNEGLLDIDDVVKAYEDELNEFFIEEAEDQAAFNRSFERRIGVYGDRTNL